MVNRVRNFFERYLETKPLNRVGYLIVWASRALGLRCCIAMPLILRPRFVAPSWKKCIWTPGAGQPEARPDRFARLREWIEGLPEPAKGL